MFRVRAENRHGQGAPLEMNIPVLIHREVGKSQSFILYCHGRSQRSQYSVKISVIVLIRTFHFDLGI